MPITFYSQQEYGKLAQECKQLRERLSMLEVLRPEWAKGYTDESIAAQINASAKLQMWEALDVSNQTDAMMRIRQLLTR